MRRRWFPIFMATCMPLLPMGCGDDHPGNNNQTGCPEGYQIEGPACIPIFDDPEDCPGPNEMPALGGGCKQVGVLQCASGFVSDGDGGCAPILPDHECQPGTMERIGQTECQPVGVFQCAQGFVPDGEGGCDAILPPGPDPCPPGTIEQIGFDTCHPLGDCGPDPSEGGSPWGLVVTDGTTVYVDATADASGANGTITAPFPTVTQAIDAVAPGGQVAIAAGEYEEILVLSKPVRLTGRCSASVILRGRMQLGQPRPALNISAGGTDSEVRGVTVTGPGVGLQVSGAQHVEVEDVEVWGTGSYGAALSYGAEATFRRVKVQNCTSIGVFSEDSTLRLEESVVRSTQPQPGTSLFGQGITAACTRADACGSVHVEGSLVVGNRETGIFASGVDVRVVSSVVRGTLPRQRDQQGGFGIIARCYVPLGACGGLSVEGCLVAGNHYAGILAWGVEARVLSSVVRDTLPRQDDQTDGWGISASCDYGLGTCGSLQVEGSVVAANRSVGVIAEGVDATVAHSVVRDTLAQLVDGTAGKGISASCDSDLGTCGSLRVEGSLVAGNRHVGIFAEGLDVTVAESVVRDTQPQVVDQTGGAGIAAQCHPTLGTCGSLQVTRSLVAGNRFIGIHAGGGDATVAASIVWDTLPQESDQTNGRGMNAQCDERVGACGSLHVEGCLVADNRAVGIFSSGVDTTVVSSVVRDTLPQESDQVGGRGINAQCDERVGACANVFVEECLVAANREIGIFTAGFDSTVVASVVRDTLPQQNDQRFGRGISAECHPETGACGSLKVEGSLVTGNLDVGIFTAGQPTELQGVAVIDTRTDTGGPWEGEHGQGIWVLCDSVTGDCGTLAMTSCQVTSSHGAGVALEGVSGFMTGCRVDQVRGQPKDEKYGFGVQVVGREGEALPTFHVRECEIRDAKLVGLLYFRSKGTLSRSVVSGGEYSVAMNEGSSPTIARDNHLSGTVENEPQWVSLQPSPAPPPATPQAPVDLPEE